MPEQFNVSGSQTRATARLGRNVCGIFRGVATFFVSLLIVVFLLFSFFGQALAQQGGRHTLFGDVKVDESQVPGLKPLSFDIILYALSGVIVGRQSVPTNGRYRFLSVGNGQYDLAVEMEGTEVARVRLMIQSPYKTDHRHDLFLEWRANPQKKIRPQTVSIVDFYERTPVNQSLFEKAQRAMDDKKYMLAESLLTKIHQSDHEDFQAWTELGTAYLMQENRREAEKAYRRAIRARPSFVLALLNLGRLLLSEQKYEGAIEPLTRAVEGQPTSAEAHHLIGEAYLRIKKGSRAVDYLNECIRLDPIGKAEVHLRLATLYNVAGMKDKAVAEYVQFLKKRPDYFDKKKLELYIAENKKPKVVRIREQR